MKKLFILLSLVLVAVSGFAQNEMTVILGSFSHEYGRIYTLSDPIKHDVNLEVNQNSVEGIMTDNYGGPLGGFAFELTSVDTTEHSAEVAFSGDIDFSQTIQIPYETNITSHSNGDTYDENVDLTITYESLNYTYFSINYQIEYDMTWIDTSFITTDNEFTIPSGQLIGSYGLYVAINSLNGQIPGEELAIVEDNVLSFLNGADYVNIELQNSLRDNGNINYSNIENRSDEFDWESMLSSSFIPISIDNTNESRDISETDVFMYCLVGNSMYDGYNYKSAMFLLCSQSYPENASVSINGIPLIEGNFGFPGIPYFNYDENGLWDIGEQNTVEITAHENTTTTDVIVPDFTSISNWSNYDTYDGNDDFYLEWSQSDYAEFYSIRFEIQDNYDLEDQLIYFTSDSNISIDNGYFPQGNYEMYLIVSPYTGVSPEFEYGGNIDGQYGFIWGNSNAEAVTIYCEIPVSAEDKVLGITKYQLTNYPNPFNPSTTISYQIQNSGNVDIGIYNIKGQLVKTLVGEQKTSGSYSLTWDAKEFSSGIYLYKLNVNGKSKAVKKCLLLK